MEIVHSHQEQNNLHLYLTLKILDTITSMRRVAKLSSLHLINFLIYAKRNTLLFEEETTNRTNRGVNLLKTLWNVQFAFGEQPSICEPVNVDVTTHLLRPRN